MSNRWAFRIIIINVAVYMIQGSLMQGDSQLQVTYYFGLIPVLILQKGFIWQIFTYMFLHGSFMHIFVNMYALLIFGIPIEETWGSKKFITYYLFTGVGAGITIFLLNIILGGQAAMVPTIGASGAVFGMLFAFGMLFPDAEILLFFVLPIKAKYLVILYGGFEFYSLMTTMGSSNISHIGHLGGLLFGIIYFFVIKRRGVTFKTKKFSAVMTKDSENREKHVISETHNSREFLQDILNRIKTKGPDTITDDEYQHINYLKIMDDNSTELCVEDDFNLEDDYCKKCESVEACIFREIDKNL